MRRIAPFAVAAALSPGVLSAQPSSELPMMGGTAAMARALGIDATPDRPRFLAEIVRVVYDTREGRSA
jgi:hypothetical protein